MRNRIGVAVIAAAIGSWVTMDVRAESAAVLPAGVSRAYGDVYRYLPTTERYNPDGDREALAHPFTNAPLDSDVLVSLEPLDSLVGGSATIGDVSVAFEYSIDVLDAGYSYGVTDRLTVGFHVPYYWITNDVDASLDASNANVGLNPATGACCIPLAAGGLPMNTNEVQELVGAQYGYSRIESWSRQGIGDIELGAKYLLSDQANSAFATTAGLRLPTGHADDPDSLIDVAWSYGTYSLLMRVHYDYKVSNLWRSKPSPLGQLTTLPGDVIFNTTLRYDYMLPDRKTKRIGDTPDQVFTNNRETVSRKLGDILSIEFAGMYQISETVAFTGRYTYTAKRKDAVSGDRGFNYESLEANTDSEQQVIVAQVSYSTLASYRETKSTVPLVLSLAYRERFAGQGPRNGQTNPLLYTRWVVLGLNVLF